METLLIRALKFAAQKHRDDRRKDVEASPYINHPIDVMSILAIEAGITDTDTLAAALLHDTLEDTDTSIEELRESFGPKITSIVIELTDDQELPRAERYAIQADKATRYSPEAKLIRLADKIANTRDASKSPPPSWSRERLLGHFNQSLSVVALIRGAHPVLEEIFDEAFKATPKP